MNKESFVKCVLFYRFAINGALFCANRCFQICHSKILNLRLPKLFISKILKKLLHFERKHDIIKSYASIVKWI